MKQWFILISTLVLLLVGGFLEINYLNKTAEKLQSDISVLKETTKSSEFESSIKLYDNLEEQWIKNKRRFSIFYRQ